MNLAEAVTSVLPVQLAVALDSLRRFRFLTPIEYAKSGGIRGLERLHIERHVREAAWATGKDYVALLRGLMCLVTADGSKTMRAPISEFQNAVGENDLQPVIDHLARGRILREQKATNSGYLLLYHDYLARGVREAYRQTNYWQELLRERAKRIWPRLRLAPKVARPAARCYTMASRHRETARTLALWPVPMVCLLESAAVDPSRFVRGALSRGWVVGRSCDPKAVGGTDPRRHRQWL